MRGLEEEGLRNETHTESICYNPESHLKLLRNKYPGNTIMLAIKLKMNGLTLRLHKEGIHLF